MDSQALNPNRTVDRGRHQRLVGAMMANYVDGLNKWAGDPSYFDYMLEKPGIRKEMGDELLRTSAENKGGKPFEDSEWVRSLAGDAFRNRRELRQKYGHIAKF
jgi:hypothetical protein